MDPVNKLQGANKLCSSEQFVFFSIIVQRQKWEKKKPSGLQIACEGKKERKKKKKGRGRKK